MRNHICISKPHFHLFLVFLCHQWLFALVGDWQYHTFLDSISALTYHNGSFYAGTSGGIRAIRAGSFDEFVFNSPKEGLIDVDVVGFVQSKKHGFWAVSRQGVLYRFTDKGEWLPFDRGMGLIGWEVNPRAVIQWGDYIVLGTRKGISFFHIPSGRIDFNVSNFFNFKDVSVTALLKKDSLLYVSTSKGIFKGVVYWPNIKNPPSSFRLKHGTLFNPQLWIPVSGLQNSAFLGWWDDELQVFPYGQEQTHPRFARALTGLPLMVEDKLFIAYSQFSMVAAGPNDVVAANTKGVYRLKNGNFHKLTNPSSLPGDNVANVNISKWGVYIWMLNMKIPGWYSTIYHFNEKQWTRLPNVAITQWAEPLVHRLDLLNVPKKDSVYLGTWGEGIFFHSPGTSAFYKKTNSCLESVAPNDPYTVIYSNALFQNRGMFIGNYFPQKPYDIAYMDFDDNSLHCWKSDKIGVTSKEPRKMSIVNDNKLIVSTEDGIDCFNIAWNGKQTPNLSRWKHVKDKEENMVDILNADMDAYGRLWVITAGRLFYEDNFLSGESGSDSLFKGVNEFSGEYCHHFLQDVNNNFWFGCQNGLIQISTSEHNPVEGIKIYTNKDGLLDNDIRHMDYRSSSGEMWIASEKGITRFETGAVLLPKKVDKVEVYPNPFLARHDELVFSGLSPSADVIILNQAGDIILKTSVDILNNGQYRWKGLTKSGKKPKPGVYYWVVKNASSASKGKLIIGR